MISETAAWWVILVILVVIVLSLSYLLFGLGMKFAAVRRPEFFESRTKLTSIYLPPHQGRVHRIWAAFVVGRKTFQAGTGLEKIERLLLPHPESVSMCVFERALPDRMPIRRDIKAVTTEAIKRRIAVRWYPQFTGYSWWIADPGSENAFVHIEMVMPYTEQENRPSLRIYKAQNNELVERYERIFSAMWDASDDPIQSQYNGEPAATYKP